MFNNELDWFDDASSKNSRQNSLDLPKSEALTEMMASSLDISLLLVDITNLVLQGLPEENLQKLRDCYTEMLGEVRECLKDLHGNILTNLSDLPHNIPKKANSSLDGFMNYVNNVPLSMN